MNTKFCFQWQNNIFTCLEFEHVYYVNVRINNARHRLFKQQQTN